MSNVIVKIIAAMLSICIERLFAWWLKVQADAQAIKAKEAERQAEALREKEQTEAKIQEAKTKAEEHWDKADTFQAKLDALNAFNANTNATPPPAIHGAQPPSMKPSWLRRRGD